MATVEYLSFVLVDALGGWQPGQQRLLTFSESTFYKDKVVAATIQPNEVFNQDRKVEVTSITFRTTTPSPSQELAITARNVGVDTINVYSLLLGTIAP